MRSLIAILLLAVFVLPLMASSMVLGQDADAGLPACCRRTGKHHCAMSMGERAEQAHKDNRFQAPAESCPYCPAHVPNLHLDPLVAVPGSAVSLVLYGQAAATPQAECSRRLARERARHKRGPPCLLLA